MHSSYVTGVADSETTVPEEVGKYIVNSSQYCPDADADYCDFFFLFTRDFVDHEKFSLAIQFPDPDEYLVTVEEGRNHTDPLFAVQSRVTSIDPDFTRFEIAFKYLWLCTTLLVMFCPCGVGFMSALKRHRKDTGLAKTFHQKWTKALLWALVWFDDPFVWGTVYSDWAKVFSAAFILSASIFVFLILLFWLCFLSDLRCMQSEVWNVDRGLCYWIPKVMLLPEGELLCCRARTDDGRWAVHAIFYLLPAVFFVTNRPPRSLSRAASTPQDSLSLFWCGHSHTHDRVRRSFFLLVSCKAVVTVGPNFTLLRALCLS